MVGKISEDADKPSLDGTEKVAAASGGLNYGILLSTIASWLASKAQTLTNKTIDAALNTVSDLTLAMFASGVVDTDGTLAANSDTRVATQKAVKAYVNNKATTYYNVPLAGADVALNNTGSYFNAVSVTPGAGTWLCIAHIVCSDSAVAANFNAQIYDSVGAAVIAGSRGVTKAAGDYVPFALQGVIVNPAGAIVLRAIDFTSTSGKINFSVAGNDTVLTLVKLG